MPFIRSVLIAFLLIFLFLLGINEGNHPFLSYEGLFVSSCLAGATVLLTLRRSFFVEITATLLTAFFLQRVLVIFFWPQRLDYSNYLYISQNGMTEALEFALLGVLAMWVGAVIARRRSGDTDSLSPMKSDESVYILGVNLPFDRLFHIYAFWIAIPGNFLQAALLFIEKIGVGGVIVHGALASVYRISKITQSVNAIAFLPLLLPGMDRKLRRLGVILLAFQVFLGIISTSKGTLATLFLTFLICMHYAGRKIGARYGVYGAFLLLVMALVYGPIVTTMRSGLLGGMSWQEAAQELVYGGGAADKEFLAFSNRLGGVDWLVGFMNVGRDAFPDYVSLQGDLASIVHSFVPKEIWPKPSRIYVTYLIPHLLRGFELPNEESFAAHGENLGIMGMAYIYFGWVGGILFMGLWAAISMFYLSSGAGRIYKILYVQNFVVSLFVGGDLAGSAIWHYQGLMLLAVVAGLHRLLMTKKATAVSGTVERIIMEAA